MSSPAQVKAAQSLGIAPGAPLEDQVSQLTNALLVTMGEVDRLRKDVSLENAKLQREFRETVDTVINSSMPESTTASPSVSIPPEHRGKDLRSNLDLSSASNRFTVPAASVHSRTGVAPPGTYAALENLLPRVEYLEHAYNGLSSRKDLNGPVALENALSQSAAFMHRADDEIQKLRVEMNEKMSMWSREFDDMKDRFRSMMEDAGTTITQNASIRGPLSPVRDRLATTTTTSRLEGEGGPTAAVECPDKPLSSFVTLSQASNMINSQVVEVASLVDVELAKMKDMLAGFKAVQSNMKERVDAVVETMTEVDKQNTDTKRHVDEELRIIEQNSNASTSQIEQVQRFIEDFTMNESATIRDEVLRLLESDSAVTQRRVEERQRRDEISVLRADVARALTTVDRSQEEVSRLTQQHHTTYQAFQRMDQQLQSTQSKIDNELRSEFARVEQVQKSFFARQEQLLASERHTMNLKVSEDVQRLQQKHLDEVKNSEKRRLDDLQNAQQQVRDDFSAFAESQRKELQDTVQKVREDFQIFTKDAQDQLNRNMTTSSDVNKRLHQAAMDELRKTTARTSDEIRRLQSQVEETQKRVGDQNSYLHTRVQQIVDEQVLRVDRMGDDIAIRLNAVVEDEVRRTVHATEGSFQRGLQQMDDRFSRELKSIREESNACRASLNAIATPSSSLQAVDSRVDVVRKDVNELFDLVSQLRGGETKNNQDLRKDLNNAFEGLKGEISRDVSQQLMRFDSVLVELNKEQAVRNQELMALSLRVDQTTSTRTPTSSQFASSTTRPTAATSAANRPSYQQRTPTSSTGSTVHSGPQMVIPRPQTHNASGSNDLSHLTPNHRQGSSFGSSRQGVPLRDNADALHGVFDDPSSPTSRGQLL